MMEQLTFDVFISYRRNGGEILGRLLFELLKDHYNVFFDHESLSSGRFDKKILDIISRCNDVIVILSPNCFERCGNPEDWFMQEISCALKRGKNIILLMTEDFVMPSGPDLLKYPENIRQLVKYNGYRVNVAYIDSVIAKLSHDMVTKKQAVTSPVDSVSEWNQFARCLEDKKFTDMLPAELKDKILRGAVGSFFDEYRAKIYTSVLDSLSQRAFNVRTKFRYEIDLNESFHFRNVDIDPDKYYELSENLSYSKKYLVGSPDRSFWLSFVTNLDELDAALRDETFFFSENLLLDREDILLLAAMDDEEKQSFYQSVLRVKINVNGATLTPQQVIIDESGIFAKYELTDDILNSSDTFDVKLRFRVPQKGPDGYFFASISEPTCSPFIRFTYPEDEYSITMIPFFNRALTAKDSKIFEGVRELSLDEWVLPVSGAIFLINRLH